VWCWDNLNIHLAPELADFAAENAAWLRVYQLPAYAPDLNPAEGIWSLLKRAMVSFAAADLDGLVRIVKLAHTATIRSPSSARSTAKRRRSSTVGPSSPRSS
jgi:transposase